MIQIAINGNRQEAHVPTSTEMILQAAMSAVEEGAESIHFHVRDEKGKETLAGKWVDQQISTLRKHINRAPIGISTGAWIEPALTKRLEQIRSWEVLPDFVSVNFDEPGYEEVTRLISEKGIHMEVGLSSIESALHYIKSKVRGNYLRILIEPLEQTYDLALKNIRDIETLLEHSGNELPVLLHGVDHTCWDVLQLAFRKGYFTRIGLEDTLMLPDGQQAKNNTELIREANRIRAACQQKSELL